MKVIELLHVIDDEKFIPFSENTFNIQGLANKYCSSEDFENELKNSWDLVVIHGLNYLKADVLLKSGDLPKVVWFMWGADAFCLGKFYNKFLSSKSQQLRIKLAFKEKTSYGIKTVIKSLCPSLIDREEHYSKIINSLSQIDVIVPVVPGDYELLKNAYSLKAPMHHISYVNPIFEKEIEFHSEQKNILIGNSASFTSNHLDVIKALEKAELGERKVIIPLNYGDKLYANFVAAYARKKIPKNVECLMDFLPFNQYQEILSTCSIVIMNHLRQQAVGNIVQCLLSGVHLYLNQKSSVFTYLKENNFLFSEISNIRTLRNLNKEEIKFNRAKCIEVFGKETQHKRVLQLLQSI